MKVRDVMHNKVTVTQDDALIADAIVTLADAYVSGLPVIDRQKRVVGTLSTTDVLLAEAECGSREDRERLFSGTTVRELMTPHAAVIGPDDDVRNAARQMVKLGIHRLFVEDSSGTLIGVISSSDVVQAVAAAPNGLV